MHPLRVAIVGSGPAGFYAAEALLKSSKPVLIDMLDKLPTPFGLVRGGVAPDHPKIKSVALTYEKIAVLPHLRYLGNVEVGKDISVAELRQLYAAVIFAYGAQSDCRLEVPGEDLAGSYAATEFVGWYNGHPDYRDRTFDLSSEVAVIIGQGNVAADVCRILATPVDRLAGTDIAEHALHELAQSRVREIHLVGRRGPAQAKFSNAELRELGAIPGCDAIVDATDLALNPESESELLGPPGDVARKNLQILRSLADRARSSHKSLRFHFLLTPTAVLGTGKVQACRLARSRLEGPPGAQTAISSGETVDIPCGVIFRSIGHRGRALPELPLDAARGVVPNLAGRVRDANRTLPGLYVTGWLKRGASGTIGTNRADSLETVAAMLEDWPALQAQQADDADVAALLRSRGCRVTSYADWRRIDGAEVARGKSKGKPREKYARIPEMLSLLD